MTTNNRSYIIGLITGYGLSATLFFWIVTGGTWCVDCFESYLGRMNYLTAMGRAILHGHLYVSQSYIDGECVRINGHCYGYYGIAPSLTRIPYLLVSKAEVPEVTPIFILIAYGLALLAIGLLLWEGWRYFTPACGRVGSFSVGLLGIACIGAGSPLLYLGVRPYMYEEVILWGVAYSLLGSWAALRWLRSGHWSFVALALLCAELAALTRPHLAFPCLALLLFVAAVRVPRLSAKKFAMLIALSAVPMASYAAVNIAKFEAVNVPYEHHELIGRDPVKLARYGNTSGESISRIPTQLVNYFRIDGIRFSGKFPIVDFKTRLGEAVHAVWPATSADFETDAFSSLPATMPLPFLLLGLTGGMAWAVRRRLRSRSVFTGIGLLVCTFTSLLAPLAFLGVVERYKADAEPLLVLVLALSVPFLLTHGKLVVRRTLPVAMLVVVVYQSLVTQGLMLAAYPELGDAPFLVMERIARYRSILGIVAENPNWTAVVHEGLGQQPPHAPCDSQSTEAIEFAVTLPTPRRRIESMVQYEAGTPLEGNVSVGATVLSDHELILTVDEWARPVKAFGPLPYQAVNFMELARLDTGDTGTACLYWNGSSLGSVFAPASLLKPAALGENRLLDTVATDDFRGKITISYSGPRYTARFVNNVTVDSVACGFLGLAADGVPDGLIEVNSLSPIGSPKRSHGGGAEAGVLVLGRREPYGVYATRGDNYILGVSLVPGGALLNDPVDGNVTAVQLPARFYLTFCRDAHDTDRSVYRLVIAGSSIEVAQH